MSTTVRNHNTTKSGNGWTEATKLAVWNKGTVIPGYTPSVWRRDKCGRAIKWEEHGNRNSQYGWEVDHINAVANGGGDEITNLQPLHWENNMGKADKLFWSCPM